MSKVNILEKIFGSIAKPKVMKLFIFNTDTIFDIKTIARRIKSRESDVKQIVSALEKIRFIKKKQFRNSSNRKANGFIINPNFVYLDAIRDFLSEVSPFSDFELVKRLGKAGKLRLIIVSGFFLEELESAVDILIVSDNMNKKVLENILKEVEADIGREVRYALLNVEDYKYRLGIGDKLLRDIFDYKHEIVLNKIATS